MLFTNFTLYEQAKAVRRVEGKFEGKGLRKRHNNTLVWKMLVFAAVYKYGLDGPVLNEC
jgi:hypothetical protein